MSLFTSCKTKIISIQDGKNIKWLHENETDSVSDDHDELELAEQTTS